MPYFFIDVRLRNLSLIIIITIVSERSADLASEGYQEENPGSGKWCKRQRSVNIIIRNYCHRHHMMMIIINIIKNIIIIIIIIIFIW